MYLLVLNSLLLANLACNTQGNEAVVDTYRWCMRCCTVLQDPATLYWDTPLGLGPFRVVAASYGHPRDPKLAIDVRRQLQTRVVSFETTNRTGYTQSIVTKNLVSTLLGVPANKRVGASSTLGNSLFPGFSRQFQPRCKITLRKNLVTSANRYVHVRVFMTTCSKNAHFKPHHIITQTYSAQAIGCIGSLGNTTRGESNRLVREPLPGRSEGSARSVRFSGRRRERAAPRGLAPRVRGTSKV